MVCVPCCWSVAAIARLATALSAASTAAASAFLAREAMVRPWVRARSQPVLTAQRRAGRPGGAGGGALGGGGAAGG